MSFKFIIKKILKQLLVKPTVHAFGDSHALVFNNFKSCFFNPFKTCIIQGATISGITNPNSQTKAYPRFKSYIENFVNKGDYVIVELGEVDCGFVLWYKAERNNIEIEELAKTTIDKYESFLHLIISRQKRPSRLIVFSTIPPTIKDNQDWGEVANLRKTINASQLQRTELTRFFNKRLNFTVKKLGGVFIDLDKYLINPETKLVKDEYLNENPLDHHLSQPKLLNIILKELKGKGLNVKPKQTNEQ